MTDNDITQFIRDEAIEAIEHTKSLEKDLPLPTGGLLQNIEYFGAKFGLWGAGLCFQLVARILPEPFPQQSDSPPEGE